METYIPQNEDNPFEDFGEPSGLWSLMESFTSSPVFEPQPITSPSLFFVQDNSDDVVCQSSMTKKRKQEDRALEEVSSTSVPSVVEQKVTDMQRIIRQHELCIKALEMEREQQAAKCSTLTQQLMANEAINTAFSMDYQKTKKSAETLSNQVRLLETQLVESLKKINESSLINQHKSAALTSLNRQIDDHEKKHEATERRYVEEVIELQNSATQFQIEKNSLLAKVQELQNWITQSKNEEIRLVAKVEEFENINLQSKNEIDTLHKKVEELQESVTQSENKSNVLEKKIEELQESITQSEVRKNVLEKVVEQLHGLLEQSKNELNSIQTGSLQLEHTLTEATNEKRSLQTEVEKLLHSLNQSASKMNELEKKAQLHVADKRARQEENMIEQLETLLRQSHHEQDSLKMMIDQLIDTIAQSDAEIHGLKAKHQELQTLNRQMSSEQEKDRMMVKELKNSCAELEVANGQAQMLSQENDRNLVRVEHMLLDAEQKNSTMQIKHAQELVESIRNEALLHENQNKKQVQLIACLRRQLGYMDKSDEMTAIHAIENFDIRKYIAETMLHRERVAGGILQPQPEIDQGSFNDIIGDIRHDLEVKKGKYMDSDCINELGEMQINEIDECWCVEEVLPLRIRGFLGSSARNAYAFGMTLWKTFPQALEHKQEIRQTIKKSTLSVIGSDDIETILLFAVLCHMQPELKRSQIPFSSIAKVTLPLLRLSLRDNMLI